MTDDTEIRLLTDRLQRAKTPPASSALQAAILADFDGVQTARRGQVKKPVRARPARSWLVAVMLGRGSSAHAMLTGRRLSGRLFSGVLAGVLAVGFSLGLVTQPTNAGAPDETERALWASAVAVTFDDTEGQDWWAVD